MEAQWRFMENKRPDNHEDARILHRVQAVVDHLEGSGLNRKSYNTALILLAAALVGPFCSSRRNWIWTMHSWRRL